MYTTTGILILRLNNMNCAAALKLGVGASNARERQRPVSYTHLDVYKRQL